MDLHSEPPTYITLSLTNPFTMSFTKAQRASSWNVEVWGNNSFCVAGVYQRDDLLSVADIAYELDLCLIFERPDDDDNAALWQPALLRRDPDPDTNGFIVLDQQDNSPFPTPTLGEVIGYSYVFHSSNCARRGLHSIAGMQHLHVSTCIAAHSSQIYVSDTQVCRNDGSTHATLRSVRSRLITGTNFSKPVIHQRSAGVPPRRGIRARRLRGRISRRPRYLPLFLNPRELQQ